MKPVAWARESETFQERPYLSDDSKVASGKIAIFQYATIAVFLFLVSGFWGLQVGQPDYYTERAERNRIKALPLLAPRGKILDREGRIMVDNHSSFSLLLSRENLLPAQVKVLAEGMGLDEADLLARLQRFDRTRPKYEPVIVKDELTPGEIAFVEAHRGSEGYPEMDLIHAQRRLYPRHGLGAHLIGYVGEVSDAELDTMEFASFKPGDLIGKVGLERQYNSILRGVDGQRRRIVDSAGRERQLIGIKEAVPGQNLQLTIDLDLQVVAELAMENRRGAVVALDPRNGEVLAMVSRPAYDPNKFTGRIRAQDWKEITNNPENPLLNRAIQAQLAPASTIKPIMALAGLDSGIIDDGFRAQCSGGATFYGRFFKCHLKRGHGVVDMHTSMVHSCDVYYYNLGNRLGIDKIAHYAELAGFGSKTGIDLPHEAEGLVPSTRWKIRTFRQKWYAGETISVAIGQGALTATPLQLAYSIGGLVTGGVWHQPHLLKDRPNKVEPRRANLEEEHVTRIVNSMYGVVNEGGTGARAHLSNVEVCGKTGTAQLASNEYLKAAKNSAALKDNAWFVGFAPRHNPEIVVAVLYEAGEQGSLAAPIMRDIAKVYFDKKARQARSRLIATAGNSRSGNPRAAEASR